MVNPLYIHDSLVEGIKLKYDNYLIRVTYTELTLDKKRHSSNIYSPTNRNLEKNRKTIENNKKM